MTNKLKTLLGVSFLLIAISLIFLLNYSKENNAYSTVAGIEVDEYEEEIGYEAKYAQICVQRYYPDIKELDITIAKDISKYDQDVLRCIENFLELALQELKK